MLLEYRQRVVVGDVVALGVVAPEVGHVEQRGFGDHHRRAGVGDAAHFESAARELLDDLLLAADEESFGLDGSAGARGDAGRGLVDVADQHRARLRGRGHFPALRGLLALCGAGQRPRYAHSGPRRENPSATTHVCLL